MANVSNNPVILRNNKKREKQSIYSRYFKESLFSFKSKSDSRDLISNINICKENSNTNVQVSSSTMSKTRSYADQVRELLKKDPINQETVQMIKHRMKPPPVPTAPLIRTRAKHPNRQLDLTPQTSAAPSQFTSQQLQLSPKKVTNGVDFVIKTDSVIESKSPSFPLTISSKPPRPPPPSSAPCSAVPTSRVKTSNLSEALRAFTASTAQSREDLRRSRQDLSQMEDTTRSLVSHKTRRDRGRTM